MSDTLATIQSMQVLVCAPDGEKLKSEREAVDLIGEAISQGVEWILVPVERLEDDFFQLETRLAGHIIQKFVMYRRRLVILGDISRHVAQSSALKAFVYETNRGTQVWFLKDLEELAERLNHMQQRDLQ
ncbi:MAG: DUF4180 domain-containing protein [Chloroflexota bacterium]|nr:DUF4180 domain-containing protein [Chloroflexota bacterium]